MIRPSAAGIFYSVAIREPVLLQAEADILRVGIQILCGSFDRDLITTENFCVLHVVWPPFHNLLSDLCPVYGTVLFSPLEMGEGDGILRLRI